MSDEEVFSHHEECPSCGSKDNVGVWKDGHKYCFGCGWKSSGTKSLQSMKSRLQELAEDDRSSGSVIDTSNHSPDLPVEVKQWLNKYSITRQEIANYRLRWNKKDETLVFPVYNGSNLVLTNERYFGKIKDHPKYITHGDKRTLPIFSSGNNLDTIIFVEDFVSAMKVGRHCPSTPLLGASLPLPLIITVAMKFKRCRVWLDMDKAVKSLQEASKASQYMEASSIFTEYDPKEYSDEDIKRHIETN